MTFYKTVTAYEYDVFGNLVHAATGGSQIDYVMDGQSRRVGKKVNGVKVQGFLFQNQLNPVAELDGSGNVVARFVYGTKSNAPDLIIKGGITYRIISDHLGSARLVVNAVTGDVVQKLAFDEFGNVLEDSNPGFQPFGFAGGLFDRDTRLVRFGARDYDAGVGRWTTKEPLKFLNGVTNHYEYSYNDPVNFHDPSGLGPVSSQIEKGLVKEDPGLTENMELLHEISEAMADEVKWKENLAIAGCKATPGCDLEQAKKELGEKLAERVKKNKPELWDKYLKDKERRKNKKEGDSCKLK